MELNKYIFSFIIGGLLCVIGQILVDKTRLTPARILTSYVVAGVVLSATGLYNYISDLAGAGAAIPLTGFGHTLAEGVKNEIVTYGFIGIFTGGIRAAAGGICAAVVFSLGAAILSKSSDKT